MKTVWFLEGGKKWDYSLTAPGRAPGPVKSPGGEKNQKRKITTKKRRRGGVLGGRAGLPRGPHWGEVQPRPDRGGQTKKKRWGIARFIQTSLTGGGGGSYAWG